MTEKFKKHNLVHYCIGIGFDFKPMYATHFVSTEKEHKSYSKQQQLGPVLGWKAANRVFKHKHND